MDNAQPQTERKPVSKITAIALRELNKNTEAALQEILTAAAEAEGINPAEGWGFDASSMTWARPAQPPQD